MNSFFFTEISFSPETLVWDVVENVWSLNVIYFFDFRLTDITSREDV